MRAREHYSRALELAARADRIQNNPERFDEPENKAEVQALAALALAHVALADSDKATS